MPVQQTSKCILLGFYLTETNLGVRGKRYIVFNNFSKYRSGKCLANLYLAHVNQQYNTDGGLSLPPLLI